MKVCYTHDDIYRILKQIAYQDVSGRVLGPSVAPDQSIFVSPPMSSPATYYQVWKSGKETLVKQGQILWACEGWCKNILTGTTEKSSVDATDDCSAVRWSNLLLTLANRIILSFGTCRDSWLICSKTLLSVLKWGLHFDSAQIFPLYPTVIFPSITLWRMSTKGSCG